MYQLRTKNCRKSNLAARWALPDRVFFACGACQVLAHVFLETYKLSDAKPIWIKPDEGHSGNHVFVSFGDKVFDYHGYSNKDVFLKRYWKRAGQISPGWDGTLIELKPYALTAEGPSEEFEGFWIRAPHQFYQNALPRAEAFLKRFPRPV